MPAADGRRRPSKAHCVEAESLPSRSPAFRRLSGSEPVKLDQAACSASLAAGRDLEELGVVAARRAVRGRPQQRLPPALPPSVDSPQKRAKAVPAPRRPAGAGCGSARQPRIWSRCSMVQGSQPAIRPPPARRGPAAVDPACLRPRSASVAERARGPRRVRPAAAGDELLGLHEELDLADAAAPELDVVAGDRDRPGRPRQVVDLAASSRGCRRPRRNREYVAPDEGGRGRRCTRSPELRCAPGDQGRALIIAARSPPVLADASRDAVQSPAGSATAIMGRGRIGLVAGVCG